MCTENIAGSHEVEVSSCVHSNRAQVRSPSRLGKKAAINNAEEASSLQTLAAAADSGKVKPHVAAAVATMTRMFMLEHT